MDRELHAGRILRMPEVCQYTGIRRSSVYRKLAEGSFPPPIRLGSRAVGWRLSDIDAWIAAPERHWDPADVK